jgi:hypothetical protein
MSRVECPHRLLLISTHTYLGVNMGLAFRLLG